MTQVEELSEQLKKQIEHAVIREKEMQQTINALQEQLEDSQSYCGYIKEQAAHDAHISELERQRISMSWELTCKEKEELSNSLWQTRAELEKVRGELENVKNELSLIKSSRGFKLLNIGFPIKRRIWKLFGKDI